MLFTSFVKILTSTTSKINYHKTLILFLISLKTTYEKLGIKLSRFFTEKNNWINL